MKKRIMLKISVIGILFLAIVIVFLGIPILMYENDMLVWVVFMIKASLAENLPWLPIY